MLSTLPLSSAPDPLLQDRLRAVLPLGSRRVARHVGGLMGMDISTDREELVIVPPGRGPNGELLKTMVYLRDRFERADESPEAVAGRAARRFAKMTGVTGTIARCESNRAIVLADALAGQRGNDILVAQAILQHPDAGVVEADFITEGETARIAADDLRAHAVRIFESFEAGPRRLVTEARVARFGFRGGPQAMSLELGTGHVWSTDRGPDFVVHHLQRMRVTSTAETTDPWIVKIYLGDHPNRQVRSADAKQVSGVLAGRSVTWALEHGQGYVSQETLVELVLGGDRVLAHIFSDHATTGAAGEVRDLVGRIQVN